MKLLVSDIVNSLHVSEKVVYRWIREGTVPAYRIHKKYLVSGIDLLDKAGFQQVPIQPDMVHRLIKPNAPLPGLTESLAQGRIFHKMKGETPQLLLRSIVGTLALPNVAERKILSQVLLAQKSLGFAHIGDGIAVPGVCNPIVVNVSNPIAALYFLHNPLSLDGKDDQQVKAMFWILSPTTWMHLYLLAQVTFALRDPGFKNAVVQQQSQEKILEEARRVEKCFNENFLASKKERADL